VKKINCCDCKKEIEDNEIALNLKLLGKQIGKYRCYHCLSGHLGCEAGKLKEMAHFYKSSGCFLFQIKYTCQGEEYV
jgi:hypothetical protein